VLFVLFHLDNDCYALDATKIVEILPLVSLKKILRPPPGIVGLLNYRGRFVPVLDLSELALGRPATSRLSTRIILAQFSVEDKTQGLLGLIAEHTSETMRCEATDFVFSGIVNNDASYLGPMFMGPRGFVQQIELGKLVPTSLLYPARNEPG
jgi:chemotaxis-related protein WspB